MGGRSSKPPVYPPIDALFKNVGCVAVSEDDFRDKRMERAPFYKQSFDIPSMKLNGDKNMADMNTPTYDAMIAAVVKTMSDIGPAKVYGPVYLLTALNRDKQSVKCYMMFPSMQKVDGSGKGSDKAKGKGERDIARDKVGPSTDVRQIATAHLWMNHLLYGLEYNVKPYSSCMNRLKRDGKWDRDPDRNGEDKRDNSIAFMHGCITDGGDACRQSETVHRGMRLFEDGKRSSEYPIAYYHAYMIDPYDYRVREYMSQAKNAPNPTRLLRNVLTPYGNMIPGCRYALVSPNQTYFYVLSGGALALFFNAGNENYTDLCTKRARLKNAVAVSIRRFKGRYNTNMFIEDDYLNIYSKETAGGNEKLVSSVKISSTPDGGPFTIVLSDKGTLDVLDISGNVVTDDAFKAFASGSEESDDAMSYNVARNRRYRILNLKAYLRLRGFYLDMVKDDNNPVASNGSTMPFNPKTDYIGRLRLFYMYLSHSGRISDDELHERLNQLDKATEEIMSASAADLLGYLPSTGLGTGVDMGMDMGMGGGLDNDLNINVDLGGKNSAALLGSNLVTAATSGAEADQAEMDDETAAKKAQEEADKKRKQAKENEDKKTEYEKKMVDGGPDSVVPFVPPFPDAVSVFTKVSPAPTLPMFMAASSLIASGDDEEVTDEQRYRDLQLEIKRQRLLNLLSYMKSTYVDPNAADAMYNQNSQLFKA